IDFAIRETLAVIDGDVAIVRLGTCGTPRKELECGTIVIANNSTLITRNPNAFRRDPESQKIAPYNFHTPTTADAELTGFVSFSFKKIYETSYTNMQRWSWERRMLKVD